MKCWNCDGLGIINKLDEDEPARETYVMGDPCPICEHGKISFQKWFKYHLARIKYSCSNLSRIKCWNCDGAGLIPGTDDEGYYEDDLTLYGIPCPICQDGSGEISFWKWIRYKFF